MKRFFYSFAIVTFSACLVFASIANAKITSVYANVFTTNYTDPNNFQLNIGLEVWDDNLKNPPDFIESIVVTAPDNTQLSMNTTNNWRPFDHEYWGSWYAGDFDSETIPTGKYKIKVTDIEDNVLTVYDNYVNTTPLACPTITNPSENEYFWRRPTLRWTAVSGAARYRILLKNVSENDLVYWYWRNRQYVIKNSFTIPNGVLKPNCQYELRIEARNAIQDTDKRSRSDWVVFFTNDWN